MATTLERLGTVLLKTHDIDRNLLTMAFPLDELGVDSLGLGLLLFDAEDEFKVKFATEPGPMKTLGDVVCYVDAELATQRQASESAARAAVSPTRE